MEREADAETEYRNDDDDRKSSIIVRRLRVRFVAAAAAAAKISKKTSTTTAALILIHQNWISKGQKATLYCPGGVATHVRLTRPVVNEQRDQCRHVTIEGYYTL